jgi:hypothetical protein
VRVVVVFHARLLARAFFHSVARDGRRSRGCCCHGVEWRWDEVKQKHVAVLTFARNGENFGRTQAETIFNKRFGSFTLLSQVE